MRRVVVVLFVLVAALGSATVVPAQSASEPVLLILDASGSMNRVDGGSRLIDIAKDALRQIVLQAPGDAQVGLRVYGHRTSNEDPVAGCVDTELVVPVGPIDRELMLGAIASFEASGYTPIGLSLQEAARDLEAVGGGTIVLVSDGVDTCAPPDPCEVAAQLAEEGILTRIHTVGFRLDGQEAADQLGCIAAATGGSFTRVDEVDSLVGELAGIVTGALEGRFVPTIQGGPSMELATLLRFGGAADPNYPARSASANGTISTGQVVWYAFDVPEGFHLLATAGIGWQLDAGPDEVLEIAIFSEDGTQVGVPHAVLEVPVGWPQSLRLVDAGDYGTVDSFVSVEAITGRTAPPAWEGNEEWFSLARARFNAAGINGGIYTLWQENERNRPLDPGRYYVAVTWEAARQATSFFTITGDAYPLDTRPLDVRDTPQGWMLNQGGLDPSEPTRLELVEWDGRPLVVPGPGQLPLRSFEVWTPITFDEPRYFSLSLSGGEVLVARTIVYEPYMGGHRLGYRLLDPDGVEVQADVNTETWLGGYSSEGPGYTVGRSGDYTFSIELTEPGREPGVLLALFVFPELQVADVLDRPADERARGAVWAGVKAVRDSLNG